MSPDPKSEPVISPSDTPAEGRKKQRAGRAIIIYGSIASAS
ncbi:hypothetical protein [Rhizobium sp. FY34]|nr:hypothetical protein [Rhizobium sp. FY34]